MTIDSGTAQRSRIGCDRVAMRLRRVAKLTITVKKKKPKSDSGGD